MPDDYKSKIRFQHQFKREKNFIFLQKKYIYK